MKKNLFMLGLAAAVLSSCSKSEVLEEPGGTKMQAIGFNSYVSNTTRGEAPVIDLDELKNKGFYVHGQFKNSDDQVVTVFDGGTQSYVTWTGDDNGGGSWGYSPINYWSAGATYKFAAFAPALPQGATHEFSYDTNSLTIKDFEADGKTDLLVAASGKEGVSADTYISSGKSVGLSFRHALSKVRISFKNGWRNDVRLVITQIKLSGVKTKGTLNTPEGMYSSGLNLGNWAAVETVDETEPISLENGNYVDEAGNGPDGMNVYQAIYPFENFFIPQELAEDKIELSFVVAVINKQNTGPDLDGKGNNVVTITAKLPVVFKTSTGTTTINQWQPGCAYNYVVEISGGTFGLHPISFEASIGQDWGADNDADWSIVQEPSAN